MDVGRQLDIAGDFVAGFAVPAHHGDRLGGCGRVPVGKNHSVFRAVEGYSWVVAHAAVNRDERASTGLKTSRSAPGTG